MYVRTPRSSKDRHHFWLLLAAVYGLVNFNTKFKTQVDDPVSHLGLSAVTFVPHFLIRNNIASLFNWLLKSLNID